MKDSTGTGGDTAEAEIVWALVNFTFENLEDQDEVSSETSAFQ